jgi:hypothetical protein
MCGYAVDINGVLVDGVVVEVIICLSYSDLFVESQQAKTHLFDLESKSSCDI